MRRLLRYSHIEVNAVVPVSGLSRLLRDDSRAPSAEYRTPLHVACARGHTDVVRLLLTHGDIDVNLAVGSLTPLRAAVLNGQVEVVRLLLADPRVNVNELDSDGNTVAHHCCLAGAVDMMHELAKHPAFRLDSVNINGMTPFMMALGAGETDLAKRVLCYLRTGEW